MARSNSHYIISKADAALKKAVKKVVAEHKRTGEPLIAWKNGKVQKISPKSIRS